jgi:hypothetical protein
MLSQEICGTADSIVIGERAGEALIEMLDAEAGGIEFLVSEASWT